MIYIKRVCEYIASQIPEPTLTNNQEQHQPQPKRKRLTKPTERKRPTRQTEEIVATVVGSHYYGYNVDDLLDKELTFEEEPDNSYDRNAIKVLADGFHCGYVSRYETKIIRTFLRKFGLSFRDLEPRSVYIISKYALQVEIGALVLIETK